MTTSVRVSEKKTSMSENSLADNSMSDIITSNSSINTKRSKGSKSITKLSRDAGRIVKKSFIPDFLCRTIVSIMELFKILDDSFSLYDKALFVLQYLSQVVFFVSTVGITATVEFLRGYHEVILFNNF